MQKLRTHAPTIAPVAYGIATVGLIVARWIPMERDALAFWVLLGLLCFSISDLRGYARGLVFEWIPFIGLLIAYDAARGSAGNLFAVHYLPQLQFDRWLFGGTTPTVTLQRWLWHGHVVWYDVVAWCIYMSHFFAAPGLAAIFWKIDRPQFRRFAVAVIVLSFAGVVTYVLYPAAPPWMASQQHLIAPITRIIPVVFASLGVRSTGSVLEHGYSVANNVAAVPSLHAAFSVLVAHALWCRSRRWVRPIVALYPLAMAFTLVYTGEHYFLDVVVGWLYAAVTIVALEAVRGRWNARRALTPLRVDRTVPAVLDAQETAGFAHTM